MTNFKGKNLYKFLNLFNILNSSLYLTWVSNLQPVKMLCVRFCTFFLLSHLPIVSKGYQLGLGVYLFILLCISPLSLSPTSLFQVKKSNSYNTKKYIGKYFPNLDTG